MATTPGHRLQIGPGGEQVRPHECTSSSLPVLRPLPRPHRPVTRRCPASCDAQGHSVTVICAYLLCAARRGPSVDPQHCRPPYPLHPVPHGRIARVASYASFQPGVLRRLLLGPRPDAILTLTTPPLLSLVRSPRPTPPRRQALRLGDRPLSRCHRRPRRPLRPLAGRSRHRCSRRSRSPPRRLRHRPRALHESASSLAASPPKNRRRRKLGCGRPHRAPAPSPAPRPFTSSTPAISASPMTSQPWSEPCAACPPPSSNSSLPGGPRRRDLEAISASPASQNAAFRPYAPQTALGEHLGNFHLATSPKTPPPAAQSSPAKPTLSSPRSRPVLYIGPPATPAQVVERYRCGWQFRPGDVESLVALLRHLASAPDLLREAGAGARSAFLRHYDRPAGVARVVAAITAAAAPKPAAAPAFSPGS